MLLMPRQPGLLWALYLKPGVLLPHTPGLFFETDGKGARKVLLLVHQCLLGQAN